MVNWSRVSDDLVVGMFEAREVNYFEQQLGWMRDLLHDRVATVPLMYPFGTGVDIGVTAALPEDVRLRTLLASFCGQDEPEWLWRWEEMSLWKVLGVASSIMLELLPRPEGRMEIRDPSHVEAVVTSVKSLGAVTEYHSVHHPDADLHWKYAAYNRWLLAVASGLVTVSSAPPLGQPG
jgi:hypothetical protein